MSTPQVKADRDTARSEAGAAARKLAEAAKQLEEAASKRAALVATAAKSEGGLRAQLARAVADTAAARKVCVCACLCVCVVDFTVLLDASVGV
jgi:hypothetical protein